MAQTQFVDFPVFNALIPREGPKAIPVLIDFSVTPTYAIDLQQVFSLARMTILQTLWVDNSANAGVVNITVSTINQTIKVPPSSQGYYPLLSGPEPTLTVSSVGGGKIQIHLLNIPVQSQTWSPAVTPFAFTGNALIVSDPALVATLVNGFIQVQPNLVGDSNLAGPQFRGNSAFRLNLATAVATNVIAGGPGWFVTNIEAQFTPDVTLAAGAVVTVSFFDQATLMFRKSVFIPTVAANVPIPVFNLSGMQLTTKTSGNAFRVQISSALTTGSLEVNVVGGTTTFIG